MYQRYVSMLNRAGLGFCVALAALSTVIWYGLYALAELVDDSVATWAYIQVWLLYLSGTVYSVLVMFRYLNPAAGGWRGVVVGFAGALSYWTGVEYVHWGYSTETVILDTATAGVFTAAFLGCCLIWLGTLRFALGFFATLCAAGGVGGAMIGWSLGSNEHGFIVGHAVWQMLTCVAFYYSRQSGIVLR